MRSVCVCILSLSLNFVAIHDRDDKRLDGICMNSTTSDAGQGGERAAEAKKRGREKGVLFSFGHAVGTTALSKAGLARR